MRPAVRQILLAPQRYSARQAAERWAGAVVANGGTVSAARLTLITTMIDASMVCGHWWNTDDMALLAAENAASALTTLKRRALMAAVNGPTFTADRDYAFDGLSSYIDTNFSLDPNARQMSVGNYRLGVYERVNLASTTTSLGLSGGGTGAGNFSMRARSASTTMITSLGASNATFTIAADSRGLKVVSRAGNGTVVKAWDRGVALTDVTGLTGLSTVLNARSLFIGARNAGPTDSFRAASIAWAEWGGPLPGSTATELAWYTALQAFMTAIGANV